jgi:hypothetical protein
VIEAKARPDAAALALGVVGAIVITELAGLSSIVELWLDGTPAGRMRLPLLWAGRLTALFGVGWLLFGALITLAPTKRRAFAKGAGIVGLLCLLMVGFFVYWAREFALITPMNDYGRFVANQVRVALYLGCFGVIFLAAAWSASKVSGERIDASG